MEGARTEKPSELGAEGVFVETKCGGGAGAVVDGHDVEAARALADVALGEEALRGAHDHALFVGGDADLGERVNSSRVVRVRTSTKARVSPS